MDLIYENSFRFDKADITRSVLDKGKIQIAEIKEDYDPCIVGKNRKGLIVDESHGNFAVAYKMTGLRDPGKSICFRVWFNSDLIGDSQSKVQDENTQKNEKTCAENFSLRMKGIESTIGYLKKDMPFFASYIFYSDAIKVTNSEGCERSVPGMRMEWINGESIGNYIQKNATNKDVLTKLADDFLNMCKKFRELGISHGDLSSKNILVTTDGQLKLVDYDSVYSSRAMEGRGYKQLIVGTPGFQHPQRLNSCNLPSSADDDNFSQQVIYLSIIAVIKNPEILDSIPYDQTQLLFSGDDLENEQKFINSNGYKTVKNLQDKSVDYYLEEMRKAIADDLNKVKSLCELADALTKQQEFLFSKLWRKYKKLLGIATIIVAIVFLGIRVTSGLIERMGNHVEHVEISQENLLPSLDGSWVVLVFDGQRIPMNDAGATITAQDTDGTNYKMRITSDSKAQQIEVNFNVNRETGELLSPELGNGKVELLKENNIGNQFKITFDKWILVK